VLARVTTFANRDTSRGDDLVGLVRERIGVGGIAGARRFLLLLDIRARALAVTLFDDEDAQEGAAAAFGALERDIPESLRGRWVSTVTFEVTIDDVAEGAGAARMTSIQGDPRRIDEDVYFLREHVVPEVADLTGWRGILALADRATGAKRTITFWSSDETSRASDIRTTQLGIRAAAAMGDSITGVDHFAVAVHEALVTA
jgi:hypothetical protein